MDDLYWGAFNINHTGQECCGFSVFDGERFRTATQEGLVRELRLPEELNGQYGVGSVNRIVDHQPKTLNSPRLDTDFSLVFDGYIMNRKELRGRLGGTFSTMYDAELASRLISEEGDIVSGLRNLANNVQGSYSVGIADTKGGVYVARHPFGTRFPLMIGEGDKGYAAATESRAFGKMGLVPSRDVEPGEILKIDDFGFHTEDVLVGGRKLCTFLWGYFGWIDSVIERVPVSAFREELITKLAERDEKEGLEVDVVCGVEDSGKAYGEGYAMRRRLPYLSSVIKYPYGIRSYERPEAAREIEAENKVSVVAARVEGKRVLLCDDSVRRGTVLRQGPIRLLREAGAEEIHVRAGTPRNTAYCRFDDRDEDSGLIANRLPTDKEIAEHWSVNSVRFTTVEDLVEILSNLGGFSEKELCLGCYNGDFGFLE